MDEDWRAKNMDNQRKLIQHFKLFTESVEWIGQMPSGECAGQLHGNAIL